MNLPKTVTNEEFLECIQRIMNNIRSKYRCVGYSGDDLAQEAYIISLKVVHSYKPETGPLFNFLSVSVKNRIKNFIRDTKKKEISTISDTNVEQEILKIGNMKTSSNEFWEMIDENLPREFRLDYIKMKQGIYLPKQRKLKLIDELHKIVERLL